MAVAVAGGSTSSTSDDTVVWEYETDVSGIYAPYDEDVSNLLEQEYRTGTSQIVDLSTVNPGLHWRVDLRKGTQRSRNGKPIESRQNLSLDNDLQDCFCREQSISQ